MRAALDHWPEYLMEGAGLGAFMISACIFTIVLQHPDSPIRHAIADGSVRRAIMGIAMGLTAILLIYSPWGRQSGAHLNPAVTFTFWRLRKIASWDALFYIIFQFLGGVVAVQVCRVLVRPWISHPAVNYAITMPGPNGVSAAFFAETAISFLLMLAILLVSNTREVARYTGLVAGVLVAIYIAIEAPVSGMSMNPARTFGSAFAAHTWTSVWIYFTGPLIGMILAAELFMRLRGTRAVICAKLHHDNKQRCIFHCGYAARVASVRSVS